MKTFISKFKDKYNLSSVLVLLIFSFLCCIPIFSNRSFPMTSKSDFIYSLNGNSILIPIIFILIFLTFKKYRRFFSIKNNNFLFATFLSLCFSSFETIGYNIDKYTRLFYPLLNPYTFTFNVLIFFGYFILFYFLINVLIEILDKFDNANGYFNYEYKYFCNNIKSVFFVSGVLILFWSIYYFIFFPAVVTWDSYYQIEQGLGFRNLTDENPFLHTLFVGFIINIGSKIFGSINFGISLFCILQMFFIAFIVAYVLKIMAKYSVPFLFRCISFLFYSCHPLIGIYSITLWKDIWIATFLLAYAVLLIDLYLDTLNFLKSKIKILCFVLVVLFIMLSKGTGIIFIFFSMIPLTTKLYKNHFLKLSIIYLVPLMMFFIIRSIVIPYFGIQKGHIREPMSVPLQQIARTVKENNENINDEEKREINEILPYNNLPNLYNPRLSDNVKSEFHEEVFSSNPKKYIRLWFKLGIKYPKSYLESFLCNSYGYWYPETKYWVVSDSSYIRMLYFYKENNWTVYDKNIENYLKDDSMIKSMICKLFNDYVREIPIVSMTFSIGFYFWFELFLFVFYLKNKRNNILPLFFIVLATFIICIMSPVHAEMRYAYPAVIMFPIIFSFSIFKVKKRIIK